jgi:uncharacterized protein DUF4232
MKLTGKIARRTIGMIAIAGTAVVVPAVALAASGSTSSGSTGAPPSATAAQSTAVGRCVTAELRDWVGIPGDGTAGSTYYQLEISNISSSRCTLYGYPGVSALRGSTQLGSAAARTPSHPDTLVTLAPGGTSHVILQIIDVGVFSPSACHHAEATSLRVYAPGAFSSLRVPLTFEGCARRGPIYLRVSADIPGTGIPGYSH